jgi:hypothetical protein
MNVGTTRIKLGRSLLCQNRYVMAVPVEKGPASPITVLFNWTAALKK